MNCKGYQPTLILGTNKCFVPSTSDEMDLATEIGNDLQRGPRPHVANFSRDVKLLELSTLLQLHNHIVGKCNTS